MSSAQHTGEAPEQRDRTQDVLNAVWAAIVIHGVGVLLALSPLHWFTAGVVVSVVGTLISAGAWRTDQFTAHPLGSPSRNRGRTAGLALAVYGCAVWVVAVLSATWAPGSSSTATTLGVLAVVPVGLGARQIWAATRDRAGTGQAPSGVHRAVIVAFTLVTLVFGVLSGSPGWLWMVLLPIVLFGFIPVGLSAGALTKSGVSVAVFFTYLAFAVASFLFGHSAWLAVAGAEPQRCSYVDTHWQESTRSADYAIYEYRCGTRAVTYKPTAAKQRLSGHPQTLVTDSTGISRALRPDEVAGWRGASYFAVLGVHLVTTALVLVPARRRDAASRQ